MSDESPSWEQVLEIYQAKCLAWAWDVLEEAGFTVIPPEADHPQQQTQGDMDEQ